MKKIILIAALFPTFAIANPPTDLTSGAVLRDQALSHDSLAWEIAEGLTTEIGPRLAGTEAEARARQWAVRKLTGLGFSNVRVEEFTMPVWVRGEERAEILSPFPQPLQVTALGRSAGTPAEGLNAEIAAFDSLASLQNASEETVRGKIVFVTHDMAPTQDGSGYGYYGPVRFFGPAIASAKGAAAIVIRSAGTDSHRNPHTGGTNWPEGVQPIPAGALSNPDADQLERILKRGQPVRMRLLLTPRLIGDGQSGNVIAEVPGTDPEAGVILIGGHLDSWDLGTGAFDNAAGVAITTAAAKQIMDAGRPRRTIRIVLFGAEEPGAFGGEEYFERHRNDGDVVLVAESDFGADRIWRFQTSLDTASMPIAERLGHALAPLGIVRGTGQAGAGADLGSWAQNGFAAINMNVDGTRYFDYHHTPDDTLDKIDPEQLRQNVAAWVAMLSIVANAPEAIGRVEASN